MLAKRKVLLKYLEVSSEFAKFCQVSGSDFLMLSYRLTNF